MNRRSFLAGLAGLIGTATLDPEKLLWIPGQKTIFLPPVGNQFLTTDMITADALRILRDNLRFARVAIEQALFLAPRFMIGDTVVIKKGLQFL